MPAQPKKSRSNSFQRRKRQFEKKPFFKKLKRSFSTPRFRKFYVFGALLILTLSTLFWSILSARVQQANADQLIDAYLFQSSSVFHGAIFPNQHTFLLKWPLFYLIKLADFSPFSFIALSVACVVVTVATLVWLLYRIDKRPLVFGTLVLALASVLIMVPTQPYPGALLPINMAMVTTRNLEYVLLLGGLGLMIRNRSVKHWEFWLAFILWSVLFASDKLFLDLAVGAAFVALVAYALKHRTNYVNLAAVWFVGSVVSALGAFTIIAAISSLHIAHTSTSAGPGPYGFIADAKNLVLGSFYSATGILSNFGANPAYNAKTLAEIPRFLFDNVRSVAALSYVTNFVIAIVGVLMAYRVWLAGFFRKTDKQSSTKAYQLASLLSWTSIAAIGAYIVTNHYYVVDARYLSIIVFAVFISMSSFLRGRKLHPVYLVFCGIIALLSVIAGSVHAVHTYHADAAAYSEVSQRNERIAQVLRNHSVHTLVGDYWRVIPVKGVTHNTQNVLPMQDCTDNRDVLTSNVWKSRDTTQSFAYLLTLDTGLTGYRPCNLQQIIDAFGKPNASALIAGTLAEPKELILYYDNGERVVHAAGQHTAIPSTVLPISLDSLPNTSCTAPTHLNIVAHEDDDLLFMNPDVAHAIAAGDCVRTVYLTAGDSGSDSGYWLSRERGSEAAYATMIGVSDVWIERIVSLSSHEYITVATSKANSKISLVFMHLPDGSIHGDGFAKSKYESLNKLYNHNIETITSVDGQSYYSAADLTNALVSLMQVFQPSKIHAQSTYVGEHYPDHSDHIATGLFTDRANEKYQTVQYGNTSTIPVVHYIGYPIHALAQNVFDADLLLKAQAFIAYSQFDGAVCNSIEQCGQTATYGAYLARQYTNPY